MTALLPEGFRDRLPPHADAAAAADPTGRGSGRWGVVVTNRPWLAIVLTVVTIGLLAVPAVALRLGLPDGSGIDLIRELRHANPRCIILVLSSNPDRLVFARAVETGASGFLHKSAALEDILEAVRRLGSGETLLSTEEVIEMLRLASAEREDEFRRRELTEQLTRREREVLQALADGLNDRQIADRLYISFETERTHMSHILAKTGADSRLQALLMAARCGIVEIRQV